MANNKLRELEANNAPLSDNLGANNNSNNNASNSKNKKEKTENKFTAFFKKIGKTFKEMFSEIKKVNWPTWKVTLVSLGTVLVVVLFFLLIVMGFDSLWTWLLGLLTQSK